MRQKERSFSLFAGRVMCIRIGCISMPSIRLNSRVTELTKLSDTAHVFAEARRVV